MSSEDKVDGGCTAAANDLSTITVSNEAATKTNKETEKEEADPNGNSLTEDIDSPDAEANVTESIILLDSVVVSESVAETEVLVESIYITETEDQTDDIKTLDLVTPEATVSTEIAKNPDTVVALTTDTEVVVTSDTDVAATQDTEDAVTPDTEVAVTSDTEAAVNPDTEAAVNPDTEVAVTLDTEVIVTFHTEVAATQGTDVAVTPDTEVAVTPETEDAVTPDTEVAVNQGTEVDVTSFTDVAVTLDIEVAVTPEKTEPIIVKCGSLELLTLSNSVAETEPMAFETEDEIMLVTEAESVGMEGNDADAEIDIQDSFMETKDEIVDDLEFIRGKLATPPTLMEDVMKHQEVIEVTNDVTNNHPDSDPATDTDSCGLLDKNDLEGSAPLQKALDYLYQCFLPSLVTQLKAAFSFIFSFSEALASLLDIVFIRAMPKTKAD